MLINTSDLGLQRPTWAEIDLDILNSNYVEIKNSVQPASVLAVVKADAYGHGATVIARELNRAGVELFGTATALEAIELRKANISTPIVVLSGMTVEQLPLLLQYDISPAVYDFEFLNALDVFTEKHRKKIRIHIKVDTGMGRLGFTPEDAAGAIRKKYAYLEVEGVYTHFANADDPQDAFTNLQLKRFMEFLDRENVIARYRHAANSAGILHFSSAHLDLVRPGLILYGMQPARNINILQKPILSLKSRIIALRQIAKGDAIGYGQTFRTTRDSVIATVPFGYADGLRRSLSNRLKVEVRGKMVPVSGTISMDLCMLDVTDLAEEIQLHDEAIFIGPRTSAWDWAELLGSIPYEVTCLIGSRVPRVYLKNGTVSDVYYP